MDVSEYPFGSASPGQTVAARARLALGLFTLARDAPLFDGATTTSEPARSSSTTTVERRTGLSTRAIALTALAAGDLAFFRARSLASPEAIQLAEEALGQVHAFLRANRSRLVAEASRDAALAKRELSGARQESAALQEILRATKDSEARSSIEGRINLANLRVARLARLSEESDRVARFFEQPDSGAGGRNP
jgi:PAS domain-containing protein